MFNILCGVFVSGTQYLCRLVAYHRTVETGTKNSFFPTTITSLGWGGKKKELHILLACAKRDCAAPIRGAWVKMSSDRHKEEEEEEEKKQERKSQHCGHQNRPIICQRWQASNSFEHIRQVLNSHRQTITFLCVWGDRVKEGNERRVLVLLPEGRSSKEVRE